MTTANYDVKYEFTQERERELLVKAFRLYNQNSFQNLIDIFKIDLEDLHRVEKFYIQTCLLLYKKHNSVEKIPINNVKQQKYGGGYVDLNIRYKNAIIENVVEVNLYSIYLIIMMNMDAEVSNYHGFTDMLKCLYIEYKNMSACDKDLGLGINPKEYINSVYGMISASINHKDSYIKANIDMSRVPMKVRMIMSKVKNDFPGHYVYIDTDSIYLARYEEIEFRLEEYLNKLMTKYDPLYISVDIHESGLFFEKKKYIIFKKGGIKEIKGFKTIS